MSKHHLAVYNGKTVVIDYAEPKREFRVAAQRVQDNLPRGGKGEVHCPDGKKYLITEGKRRASPIH